MPLLGSRGGGSVRGFGRFGKAILLAFLDIFNRSGSLNASSTSDGKGIWKLLAGSWSSNNGSVTTSTNGSLAVVDIDATTLTNAKVTIDGQDGGVGLAFWAQDGSNFYAAYPSYNQATNTTTSCGGSSTLNNVGCGTTRTGQCYREVECANGQQWNLGPCNPASSTFCNNCCGGGVAYSNVVGACQDCYQGSTSTTTTTYTSTFQIRKNASIISSTNYSSNTSAYNRGYSVVVSTSGNLITANLYSGTNGTGSSVASVSSNESSPVKGSGVGIFRTSSPFIQGSTVSNLSVTATA